MWEPTLVQTGDQTVTLYTKSDLPLAPAQQPRTTGRSQSTQKGCSQKLGEFACRKQFMMQSTPFIQCVLARPAPNAAQELSILFFCCNSPNCSTYNSHLYSLFGFDDVSIAVEVTQSRIAALAGNMRPFVFSYNLLFISAILHQTMALICLISCLTFQGYAFKLSMHHLRKQIKCRPAVYLCRVKLVCQLTGEMTLGDGGCT